MSIIKIGNPPFPAKQSDAGRTIAKMEHIWHSVRRWARSNGYEYTSSYGVIGVGPT